VHSRKMQCRKNVNAESHLLQNLFQKRNSRERPRREKRAQQAENSSENGGVQEI